MNNHLPVLLDAVLNVLAPKSGDCFIDATAGYGGHAAAIIQAIGPTGGAILIDRDATATRHLSEQFKDTAQVIHASFLDAAQRLTQEGILADMILLDLGVSSPQLDTALRGFSF